MVYSFLFFVCPTLSRSRIKRLWIGLLQLAVNPGHSYFELKIDLDLTLADVKNDRQCFNQTRWICVKSDLEAELVVRICVCVANLERQSSGFINELAFDFEVVGNCLPGLLKRRLNRQHVVGRKLVGSV